MTPRHPQAPQDLEDSSRASALVLFDILKVLGLWSGCLRHFGVQGWFRQRLVYSFRVSPGSVRGVLLVELCCTLALHRDGDLYGASFRVSCKMFVPLQVLLSLGR